MSDTNVDVDEVIRAMVNMQRRGADLRPVFRALKKDLVNDLDSHFAERAGPGGAWPPWSRATLEKFLGQTARGSRHAIGPLTDEAESRRRRRHLNVRKNHTLTKRGMRRLGNMLGRLRGAFKLSVTESTLVAESLVPFSGVQNDGGRVGRGAYLPSREFAFASDALLVSIVAPAIVKALEGAFVP